MRSQFWRSVASRRAAEILGGSIVWDVILLFVKAFPGERSRVRSQFLLPKEFVLIFAFNLYFILSE